MKTAEERELDFNNRLQKHGFIVLCNHRERKIGEILDGMNIDLVYFPHKMVIIGKATLNDWFEQHPEEQEPMHPYLYKLVAE